MSAVADEKDLRSERLARFFGNVTDGKRPIKSSNDAKLFLESICINKDHLRCIQRLVSTPAGLRGLRMSFLVDVSSEFVNESSAAFLEYIAEDEISQACSGHLLREVLDTVAEPPTFWNALQNLFSRRELSQKGMNAYASLVLMLLSTNLSPGDSEIFTIAEQALDRDGGLVNSPSYATRSIAYKIQHLVRGSTQRAAKKGLEAPGGRHDNDFEDFRKVAIFPTTDELMAKDPPYLLPADLVTATEPEQRAATHIDNQFRLLREEMLTEMRDDLQVAKGQKPGKRFSLRLQNLVFRGIDAGDDQRRKAPSVMLQCWKGLPDLGKWSPEYRKKHYKDNRSLLKHGSFGCLLQQDKIIAFVTVDRNEDRLSEHPPVLVLQVLGTAALLKTLIMCKMPTCKTIELVLVNTPFFAYEPVLKGLQNLSSLPLAKELLHIDKLESETLRSPITSRSIVRSIEENEGRNIRHVLNLPKDVILDHSQTVSVVAGLLQTVSVIQGPPGTGKSFCGALIAKALYESTNENILVLCYTNHAVDQFLEDIMDIGVPESQILHIGSKSTARTFNLKLQEQTSSYCRSRNS